MLPVLERATIASVDDKGGVHEERPFPILFGR